MSVSRIHRLLRLITLLQGARRYTAADLAGELEVSKRTIFRDLNMLELARIPYYFDPKTGAVARTFDHPYYPSKGRCAGRRTGKDGAYGYNTEFLDFKTGRYLCNSVTRGTCGSGYFIS